MTFRVGEMVQLIGVRARVSSHIEADVPPVFSVLRKWTGGLQRKLASYTDRIVKLGVQMRKPASAHKVKKLRTPPHTNRHAPANTHAGTCE